MAGEGSGLVWFEPVSTAKAGRAAQIMHNLDFVSPNAAELIAMAASVQKSGLRIAQERSSALFSRLSAKEEILDLLPYAEVLLAVRIHLPQAINNLNDVMVDM